MTIDEDSYQLSVTANFILRGTRDHLPENKTRLNKGDFLRSGDFDSYSERETGNIEKGYNTQFVELQQFK